MAMTNRSSLAMAPDSVPSALRAQRVTGANAVCFLFALGLCMLVGCGSTPISDAHLHDEGSGWQPAISSSIVETARNWEMLYSLAPDARSRGVTLRFFEDIELGELLARIASENGMSVVIGDSVDQAAQVTRGDIPTFGFLLDSLAEQFSSEWIVDSSTIYFIGGSDAEAIPVLSNTYDAKRLVETLSATGWAVDTVAGLLVRQFGWDSLVPLEVDFRGDFLAVRGSRWQHARVVDALQSIDRKARACVPARFVGWGWRN